jgi:hypothetical protein
MTYKQYTSCVQASHFIDLGFNPVGISRIILILFTVGVIAFVSIYYLGGYGAIVAAIALVGAIIAYLNWWLYGRLICLGDDLRNCAIIGMVLSHGPSNPRDKAGDNDYTMNVLLAPGPTTLDESKEVYWSAPQGHLVAENSIIFGVSRGYVQEGKNLKYMKAIHCEFEGDGIRRLLDAAYGVMAILIASLVVPGLWIVAVIIAILAILRGIFAEPGAPGAGTPLDIDPSLGSMDKGDVVIVRGEWVYDSLHAGWNEIHPVRACQIIGRLQPDENGNLDFKNFSYTDLSTGTVFTLDSAENVERFRDFWCNALDGADDAEDDGSKDNPEHDWGVHPTVDGCKPPIIIT